jgi:hypothetical protein
MSKNTNLSFLTDFLTADIVNSRVGMNNVSPQSTFDVTGTGKFSGVLTLGSTVSNGTYTYTLPSATGTLALTSQIPSVSGYVPYTGANQNLDLGTNDITSRYVVAAGSAGLGGVISIRQDATYLPKGNGYSSIASSFTAFDFYGYTGASTYKNFSFRFDGLTNNTLRTYTLPDADGTIALTSAIPANPVGGTGTTNYLAKFTGSTTIGNSQIIDNGAQVGIGLTPNASYGTLQIKSPASVYSIDLVGRNAGLFSENQITFWNAAQSVGLAYIYNSSSNLYIGTGANQPFTLSSGGNFIFGSTTDAGFKLDVNGTGRFSNSLTSGGKITSGQGAFRTGGFYVPYSTASTASRTWAMTSDEVVYGDFGIITSSTQTGDINTYRIYINPSGNVGIGTTAPASKLHIEAPTASYGQFRILNTTSGSGEASIHLGRTDQAIDNRWTIGQGTAGIGNDFGFYSAGNRLVITTGGNVGIATNSPGVRFVNSGGSNASLPTFGSGTIGSDAILSANGLYGLYTGVSNEGHVWQQVQRNDGSTAVYPLVLQPSGGNVGIGTTSPTWQLQVEKNTNSASTGQYPAVVVSNSNANGYTAHYLFSGVTNKGGIEYSNGEDLMRVQSGGAILFNTTSSFTERMRITSGGNVLIGTTTDNGRRLNVNGTGLFSGTLSTAKVEVGSVNSVNITTNSTFTLIPSSNFNIRTNILVSVTIRWDNNANAQRQYLLFIGGTDTGWGTPNSAISVIASNDWSSGYVGAASFSIGGSGQLRTLNISVSNAATYNVTAYAAIVDM